MICRICYEEDKLCNLITPCYCKGTMKFVHHSCLQTWMEFSQKDKCEMCKFSFQTNKKYYYPSLSFLEEDWFISGISVLCILVIVLIIGRISHLVFRKNKRYNHLPYSYKMIKILLDSIRSTTVMLTFGCVWGSSFGLFEQFALDGDNEIDIYKTIYRIVFQKLKKIIQNCLICKSQINNIHNYDDDSYYPLSIKKNIS